MEKFPIAWGKMPFENKNLDSSLKVFDGGLRGNSSFNEQKKEKASFTSKKRIDTYLGSILIYMFGIDFQRIN